jgi:hypothetical protein
VNADEVDDVAGGVNADDVAIIADGVNPNELGSIADGMNPDEVDCFADGVIDTMGTAISTISNNKTPPAGLLVATKRKRKPTDLSLRFLEK